MAETFGMMVYGKEDVPEILERLGYEIMKGGYVAKEGNTVRCACCGRALRASNLGNILPGSNILYCDNPVCFTEYVHLRFNY